MRWLSIDTQFNLLRLPGEGELDYFVRLFDNKDQYSLNCEAIAVLLNADSGHNYDESAYRKKYTAFNLGRLYERGKLMDGVVTRILDLSDFHYPYALPKETFGDYISLVDVLVLNGDIQDAQSCSHFSKKYRIPFVDEMIGARQYLIDLIDYIHPKKVIVIKGNHEDRLLRLLSDSLNDDLLGLMPDSPLDLIVNDGFKNHDRYAKTTIWYSPIKDVFTDIIVEYTGDWWRKVGKAIFAHPLTYSSGMLKTTEKAVDYFLRIDREFDTIAVAHTHKLGHYIQGNIHLFEQGCCCKTEAAEYSDGKLQMPQQKGFLYLCQDKDGNLLFDKCKVVAID